MKHLILATAGHVDHGKSALVRALTGVDPDRLPEEKTRGITIDLGFAPLELPATAGGGAVHLGLIDVPGHEDFVKNMVAGVGAVDVALLVVAADDGWMPQTEEHLQILMHLGVRHAVVALSKADLAGDLQSAIRAVSDQLKETPFSNAPIVPTSIADAPTIMALRNTLAAVCATVPAQRDTGKPRLAVDRAFTLRGVGTIVTGTLADGCFARDQSVVIYPSGAGARIRALQSHGRELTEAGPGRRIALNLADAPLARGRGQQGVRRGDVIALASAGAVHVCFDAQLTTFARCLADRRPPLIRSGCMVRIHYGSGSLQARVRLLDMEEMRLGQTALARLSLESPLLAFIGDRFILRDSSCNRTLAGGVVLEPGPPTNLDASHRRFMAARASDFTAVQNMIRTQLVRDGALNPTELLVQSRFSAAEVESGVSQLLATHAVVRAAGVVADRTWWRETLQRAESAILAEHRSHPERIGLSLAQLRAELGLKTTALADAVINDLCRDGFLRVGTAVKSESHRTALPPALQTAGFRIRSALVAKPLEPPSRKELAGDSASFQALRFLVESGEATEVGPDLVMDAAAFEQAKIRVVRHLRERSSATTGELREALGTSRRVIVPFLERLDKDGLTGRVGDKRVLRAQPACS